MFATVRKNRNTSPHKALLTERSHLGDDFEVAVAVQEKDLVFDRELRNAAIDRAPNGLAAPAKVKKDAGGVGPGRDAALQIVLSLEVLVQKAPFTFVERALQQFELMKSRKYRLVALER